PAGLESAMTPLTLVEILEVVGPTEETLALIRTVIARLEREGVLGLGSMQFYLERLTVSRASDRAERSASRVLCGTRGVEARGTPFDSVRPSSLGPNYACMTPTHGFLRKLAIGSCARLAVVGD